jgi:hypothetical protein
MHAVFFHSPYGALYAALRLRKSLREISKNAGFQRIVVYCSVTPGTPITSPTSSVWRAFIQLKEPIESHKMASKWAERPTRPFRLTDVTVRLTMPTSMPRRAEAVQRVR